jgi:hypothetical protein
MKKPVITMLALFGLLTMSAQEVNAGLHLGLPLGETSDLYTFNLTLDVTVLWEISEDFEAGATTGLSSNFGDEVESPADISPPIMEKVDDAMFLPIAGTARYEITEAFTLGVDLGYAIGLAPSSNDGGFYFAPRAQYDIADDLDIVLSYRGISNDGTFSVLNLGVEYEF